MAIIERSKPTSKKDTQKWAIPLQEELDIDQEALESTIALMPQKMGLGYEELIEQKMQLHMAQRMGFSYEELVKKEGNEHLRKELIRDKPGMTYDELVAKVKPFKQPETANMSMLDWFSTMIYGQGWSNQALKNDPYLKEQVFKFTFIFNNELAQIAEQKGLTFNYPLMLPYGLVPESERPRLLRLPIEKANGFTPIPQDRFRTLSMNAAQIIDRAARGPGSWTLSSGKLPRYQDSRSGHYVEYAPPETDLASLNDEALKKIEKQVMDMNPRTADVWRLITACSLEAWQEGQLEPPAVWQDVRELARAMGYTEHVRGGMKPEHLFEVAKAINDLEGFHITIPIGEKVLELPDKNGRRKSQKLQAARHFKVLQKVAWEDVRDMFGHQYPVRWKLKPGEWIQLYPRQFAQLFRSLVEMPAKAGKYLWAKSIGTELAYYYRQDRSRTVEKVLKVSTILERACLINEAKENKNKKRVRDYFEDAMDLLKDSEVCEGWEYYTEDINAIEASYRGWFDMWLEARIRITAPEELIKALPNVKTQ